MRHSSGRLRFTFLLLAGGLLALACSRGGRGPAGAGAGSAAAGGSANQGPPPVPAQVVVAERTPMAIELEAVGSLRSPKTTIVSTDVAGIVVALDAPEGRQVRAGHLLARLDPAVAQAELQVAQARSTNAEVALQRLRPLFDQGVVSNQVLDNAVAEQNTARGLLAEAMTRVQKTEVRAPFAGRLGLTTAQVGQYVAAGEAIVELTQVDPLELTFTVPEGEADAVRVGQTVAARAGRCGAAFAGTVDAIEPTLDPRTRTLEVQARVPNPDGALRPGMSATVRLRVGERAATLHIPREALVAAGTRYLVWVVGEGESVEPRPVTPGRFQIDTVEIASGLAPGERIVAAGHQKLRPNARVAPLPWQPTENADLALGQAPRGDCGDAAGGAS